MNDFRPGDRVAWHYIHHLNSQSSVERVKTGVFIRAIGSTVFCLVLFDGNRGYSRIAQADLKPTLHYPRCLNCGKNMTLQYDPVARKITGYLWSCGCMPTDRAVAIG